MPKDKKMHTSNIQCPPDGPPVNEFIIAKYAWWIKPNRRNSSCVQPRVGTALNSDDFSIYSRLQNLLSWLHGTSSNMAPQKTVMAPQKTVSISFCPSHLPNPFNASPWPSLPPRLQESFMHFMLSGGDKTIPVLPPPRPSTRKMISVE